MTTPAAVPPPALVVEVAILLPSVSPQTDLERVGWAIDSFSDALGDRVEGASLQLREVRWSR